MLNRKIISLLCAASIVTLTCSCGKSNDNNTESKSETITIWAFDTSASAADKAVEIYKRNHPATELDFNVVSYGQDDMVEKIKIALSTNSTETLPDMFYDEDYNFYEYVSYHTDLFYDVTSYISDDSFYDYKTINVTYNDRQYAIPYDSGTGVMFYRTDLIAKAGYTDEDMKDLTWGEYINIGKDVKKATGKDMLIMCPDGDMEGRLMYQSAGVWFFDENGKPNMNNPAFHDAFTTMKAAYDADIVYNASSWDDYISAISNEKMVSLIGASWWAPIISEYTEQSGLWRVTNMPRMEGSNDYKNYSNLGGGNWFIINNQNSDNAAKFATEMFAENQELANYMADQYLFIPVNANLVSGLQTTENEFFGNQNVSQLLCEYNSEIIPVKYGLNTYEMTYTVGPIAGEYLADKITLEDAIDKMEKAAEQAANNVDQ